ncbi:hypothetical protein F5X68DRAFT_10185 [Plectosphaerella plurivora]|uniref:Uncharacterized protein n=1 Tax=Plectosphaerella plurivora TaxID=936078 RepID=A0A9P8VC73_9PEZI|nr:hypothetical protein F5X68DRAFT_10185 [Plectosphaerella plurivora]
MERDVRRDRGQWRGCYSFKDIVCDDDQGAGPKRNGGLKMGHTYYYYYELDGSYETHDHNVPSTTHCPYLPGQLVNTLEVPNEHVLRKRSASLSSMRSINFMTTNPRDKFITPRPAPRVPEFPTQRLGTAPHPPSVASSVSSDRPMSPTSSWRRLFRLRSSSRGSERGRSHELNDRCLTPDHSLEDTKSIVSSHGTRSRDISPESLRRFLVEDSPIRARTPGADERPTLSIPEDIAEENEDDDNFASSAVSALSENNLFPTCLSPPPFKRSHSDGSMPTATNSSQMTLTQYVTSTSDKVPRSPFQTRPDTELPGSRFSISSVSSAVSTGLPDDETPSFYDSHDDDDVLSSNDGDAFPFQPLSLPSARQQSLDSDREPFPGYSLPRGLDSIDKSKADVPVRYNPSGSPPLMPLGHTSLLAAPGDHGIDDFVSEMAWMVGVIHGKPN